MRDYLVTAEVARILAVSEVSLSNWRRAGVGPLSAKRGAEFRYPKNAFRDYLESLTGGDPVPRDLNPTEKRRLFARLHRDEPPLADGPSRAELANRLAVVEGRLAKIEAEQYRKPAEAKTRAMLAKAKTRKMTEARKAATAEARKGTTSKGKAWRGELSRNLDVFPD